MVTQQDGAAQRLWGLARRVGNDVSAQNLTLIAAGMAYNAIFALFPALAALVSVYGLMADPGTVTQQVSALDQFLPSQATKIIGDELNKLAGLSSSRLGLSFLVSLAVALLSVASGVKSIISGLNVAYDAKEHRSFLKLWAVAVCMAIGAIVVSIAALSLAAVLPLALSFLNFSSFSAAVVSALRWPVLAVMVVSSLSVLYRWGP